MKHWFVRFLLILVAAAVTAMVLIALSYLAMGMNVGIGAICGASGYTMEAYRDKWFNDFSWMHFGIQGIILWNYNLWRRRKKELVYISWPTEGWKQIMSCVYLFLGFILLEVLAYLIQFVGNAIYIAITNWVANVTVPNNISLGYLKEKVDPWLIGCETSIAALIISFFDRRNRRVRVIRTKRNRRHNEPVEQEYKVPKHITFFDYPQSNEETKEIVDDGIKLQN